MSREHQPREREIVVAILEYLTRAHKQWCWVRVEPVTAMRMALKAKGIMRGGRWKDSAWSDGVADIIGIGKYHIMPDGDEWGGDVQDAVAFEVKTPTGSQRASQIIFQARWERAGGRYYIVRSIDDVMEAMK